MLKRAPHPANLNVSWSNVLSKSLKMMLTCQAESDSSNSRIIRTTKEWIKEKEGIVDPSDVLMVIQWSTWEREEWNINGVNYQVSASGEDHVPGEYLNYYKEYITNINWEEKTQIAFATIIQFHLFLEELGFKHIFVNGNNTFFDIPESIRFDFKDSYIEPYLPEGSYDGWLQLNGYNTVITSNYHYGSDAHAAWAKHLLQHIKDNKMIT